jgi:dTDP-4-dehydrorhamnose reductase
MNKHSKIIIVGATGYIGKQLHIRASANSNVYGTSSSGGDDLNHLQLNSPDTFNYGIIQPSDIVFLSAAISAPDICAREHARAWAVNVTGTSEFIEKVMSRGSRVVFFSSDAVYGDRRDGFDEAASINPAGEYAEMKAEVERRFLGNPLFKSIRLSYVFSREDKFTKYLSVCAERGEEAELFHPFYRAIVHRCDVIAGALALYERWDEFPQQVINFGGPEVLSRIDFAECLKQNALPGLRFRVSEPGDEFFKNRPRVIAMSSDILPKLLRQPSRTMAEAAQIEFLQN